MKLIRNLEQVELLKATKEKQNNGTNIKTWTLIKNYNVQKKTLSDLVNATLYGSEIVRMYEISSPLQDLEKYLMPKVDNVEDNISLYVIKIGNNKYKINSVKLDGIVIERIS